MWGRASYITIAGEFLLKYRNKGRAMRVQWVIPGRHLSRTCQLPAADVSVFNLADIVYRVSCCSGLKRHAHTAAAAAKT